MTSIRRTLENAKPAIITVGIITVAQGFVATLLTDGPAAPAIMLAGMIAIVFALIPGARTPET